jgi:RNase P protein component
MTADSAAQPPKKKWRGPDIVRNGVKRQLRTVMQTMSERRSVRQTASA